MTQAWWPPVIHCRDRRTPTQRLATTQTSRCASLLSARCPVQHAYIIACCHVITSDYLIGTTTLNFSISSSLVFSHFDFWLTVRISVLAHVLVKYTFVLKEEASKLNLHAPRTLHKEQKSMSGIIYLPGRWCGWGRSCRCKLSFSMQNLDWYSLNNFLNIPNNI